MSTETFEALPGEDCQNSMVVFPPPSQIRPCYRSKRANGGTTIKTGI